MLSEIGITASSDGTLSIADSAAFETAVSSDPLAVSNLFRLDGGVAQRIKNILSPYISPNGYLDDSRTSIQSQITSVQESIKRMEDRLTKREEILTRQYTRLAEAISSYQSQMSLIQQFQSIIGG